MYEKKGDYDYAIPDFDQSLRLNPSDADSFAARGWAYAQKSNYDRAIQDYDEALKINPIDLRVLNNRRLSYVRGGHYLSAMVDERWILYLKFGVLGFTIRLCLFVFSMWILIKAISNRL